MNNSKTKFLLFSICCISCIIQIQAVSANFIESYTIDPYKFDYTKVTFQNDNPQTVILEGNDTFNLYIINKTQLGQFLINFELKFMREFINISKKELTFSAEHPFDGLSLDDCKSTNGDAYEIYLLMINPHDTTIFIKKFDSHNILEGLIIADLFKASTFAVMALYFLVSIRFIRHARELQKKGEEEQGQTLLGYGFGFFSAGLLNILAEIEDYWWKVTGDPYPHLYPIELPQKILMGVLSVQNEIFLIFLALTFGSVIYQIEKRVIVRKYPILSWNIVLAASLTFLIFLFPSIVVWVIIYFIASLAIAYLQLAYIYLKIAIQSSDEPRKKAFLILFGITLAIYSFIFRTVNFEVYNDLIHLMCNLVAILGLYAFYKANN